MPHRPQGEQLDLRSLADDSQTMRDLFEAAVEVVHEAVLNSLCSADTMEGRDGHLLEALPYELLSGAPGLRALG